MKMVFCCFVFGWVIMWSSWNRVFKRIDFNKFLLVFVGLLNYVLNVGDGGGVRNKLLEFIVILGFWLGFWKFVFGKLDLLF